MPGKLVYQNGLDNSRDNPRPYGTNHVSGGMAAQAYTPVAVPVSAIHGLGTASFFSVPKLPRGSRKFLGIPGDLGLANPAQVWYNTGLETRKGGQGSAAV